MHSHRMRRYGYGVLILAAVVGMATVAAAEDKGASDPSPSLEYRPPRVVIPEPKAPHPLPPKTIFAEAIGSLGMLGGSFDRPTDIVRNADGSFYVLDVGNNRIQAFNSSGVFTGACGSRGIQKGEFDKPSAIAFPPGDSSNTALFVVDTGNDRIQICDMTAKGALTGGKILKTCPQCTPWGARGSGWPTSQGPQFNSPRDIAVSSKGTIAILDSGNDRIQFFGFSPEMTFFNKWDSGAGVTGGNFTGLVSLAWSDEREGYLYVFGAGCVVQQFQPDPIGVGFQGKLITSWPAIPAESGLCVPARMEIDTRYNYVYVLDSGNSQLSSYNPNGLYRWTIRSAQMPFDKPLGFAMDASGEEFLVADTENNVVQKFTLR